MGRGTGDSAREGFFGANVIGSEFWVITAKTSFMFALWGSPSLVVSWIVKRSASQHAQEMVLRSHSGDPINGFDALVLKEIASQETKASSCWTRMRGLVPTCASSTRDAARARCESGLVPFLSRSRVFKTRRRSSPRNKKDVCHAPSRGTIMISSRPSRLHFLSRPKAWISTLASRTMTSASLNS